MSACLVRGVGVAQDVVAGGDELPQQRLFADDAGVMRAVGGMRAPRRKSRRDIAMPPISSSSLPLDQLLAHDHRIDGAVLLVELDQDVEDDLVIGLEERFAIDDLHDLPDDVFVEHHRRQQAHLRFDRMRRQTVERA